MFKRVFLFIATNLLVMTTLYFVISLLGLHSYLTRQGIDYQQLAIFCLIWGMGGAFISLLLSKFMAKMAMGVVMINPQNITQNERVLLEMVYRLAQKAGLKKMPDVGIYNSPELNAFATGPSKNHALVAVSSGLLNSLNQNEVEAVLGHEISHVANDDMVTMTLVQGVINSFSMFLSRLIAYGISLAMSRDEENHGNISYLAFNILTFVFDILFTLLGSVLVAAYSRWREYRADLGSATLVGASSMIAALRRLSQGSDIEDERAPALAALKISHRGSGLQWLSSHPTIESRIERLSKFAR